LDLRECGREDAHEAGIRLYDWASGLDEGQSLLEIAPPRAHDVRDGHGPAARHAERAVDEHALASTQALVDLVERGRQKPPQLVCVFLRVFEL
jgi:hypothetical protein